MDPFEDLIYDKEAATQGANIDKTKTKINIAEFMPKKEEVLIKKKPKKKKDEDKEKEDVNKEKGATLQDILARRK
jgi:hypothetical protein